MRSGLTHWRQALFLALIGFVLLLSLALPVMAQPREKITVGVLRFSSSGPLFLAKERRYFDQENLDVELVFFEAAPTIATAVASGDLTFGVTALTAALFNLAAYGQIKLIAGQAREEKGHPGNMILVTRKDFEAGITQLEQLLTKPFGLTQMGSPSHYQLGQLARRQNVPLSSVSVHAFQTLPNLVAALKANRVTWAIIAPPVATSLLEAGDAVKLADYAEFGSFQFGAVFATDAALRTRSAAVRGFLRAYKRGLQDYAILNATAPTADPRTATEADEAAAVIAKYLYPQEDPAAATRKVRAAAFYVDPSGRLDPREVADQIRWYFDNGFLRQNVDASTIIRLDFLE